MYPPTPHPSRKIAPVESALRPGRPPAAAAPADQSSTTIWSCDLTLLDVTGDAISDDYENTEAIVTELGTSEEYAARLCWELELEGYDDWFLPSINEMIEIHDELVSNDLGDFNNPDTNYYWTSTENTAEKVYVRDTSVGGSSEYSLKVYTTQETATHAVSRF